MKASIQSTIMGALLCFGLLSGCATTSDFSAKVATWKGESADTLVQAWGQPDAIEPLHTGDRMYVYTRLKHEPIGYPEYRKIADVNLVGPPKPPRSPASSNDTGIYIHCSAYFEVTRQNIVESVQFRGDECK